MPPPRSAVLTHHELFGVTTTNGARVERLPAIRAWTLHPSAGSKATSVVSRISSAFSAAACRRASCPVATCSAGGPNGTRKWSAFCSASPGTSGLMLATATSAASLSSLRASANARLASTPAPGPSAPRPITGDPPPSTIARPLAKGRSRPTRPSGPVVPPSNSGTPSMVVPSTSISQRRSTQRERRKSSRRGVTPASRTLSASQSAASRSPAVPVRCSPMASHAAMSAAT